MRLEFIPKTKSTLLDVTVLSLKKGQTDVDPAVCIEFETAAPNTVLNMLHNDLRGIYYTKKGNPNKEPKQAGLEGVEAVSDLPHLTEVGELLGVVKVGAEQTGCTLHLYHGIGARPAWTFKDVTVRKVSADCQDGGTVKVRWQAYTADVDAEKIGEVAVLKSHVIDLELRPAEVVQQQLPAPDDAAAAKNAKVGPAAALAAQIGKDKAAAATH